MSQDIRKWFAKPKESISSGSTHVKPSTLDKPPATVPNTGKMGIQECSGRRKTSKYFGQSPNDEMEVEEISAKKLGRKGNSELANNVKPAPGKKIHKLEDNEEDEDFVTPASKKNSVNATPNKKLKSGSVAESMDRGVVISRTLDSLKGEQAEHLIKQAEDMIKNHGGCVTGPVLKKTYDEDIGRKSEKAEEFGDRIRGRRGAPAGGRGRGSGGRGGFANFSERKDPPHKGEKEVPEGAADCLHGLTFVISGTLDSLEREEAADLIKRHGGRVTGFISKKTNYLLCDEDICGRKSEKAKELGTKFLTEDGLFDMIRESNKSKESVTNAAPSAPNKSPQKPERNKQAGRVVASSGTKSLATVAASPKQPNSQPTSQTCLPWTEKYRPKVPNDIVGNQSLVKQLQDWLLRWNERFLDTGKRGKGKKQNDSGAKKAVLLSGTPGIGKTSSAKLVSQMLGFQTVEVNASDSRGKADGKIEKGIGGSTSNLVKELVSNEALSRNIERSKLPKTVLIMDEVDGMSAGDRGGVADLIASIKISKIPIICICNDRYSQKLKSLVNYCLLLSFRKPTKQQISKRLSQIATAEGLQVNEIALEELAERTNGDIRMALNNLQYMSLSMSVIKFDDIRERLQISSKDEEISPFTAADKLFSYNSGKLRMDERIDLCMSDPDLVPLLIQENYINYRPSAAVKDDNGMKRTNLLSRAAESIGDGDIVNVQIRRYRQWQLSQIGSLVSCIIPVALLRGQREVLEQGERNYNRFGGWLGKNSTMGKNYRLMEDLHVHLLSSRESNLGRTELRLDYLTTLLKRLADPLKTLSKDEAVERVLEFMEKYSISMEDFDTIMEISKFKGHPNPLDGVQPAVKSALTRTYNKCSLSRVIRSADLIMLPGMKKAPKKWIAAMLEPAEDTLAEDAESEESGSGTEDQEDDSVDPEREKLQSDLQSLNSKAIKVEMELKGSRSSSAKKASAGRGKESSAASSRGGRGSRAVAPKRKR